MILTPKPPPSLAKEQQPQRASGFLLGLFFVAVLASPWIAGQAQRPAGPPFLATGRGNLPTPERAFLARVEGWIKEGETGRAVEGARVQVPEFGLAATSGPDGYFSFPPLPLNQPAVSTRITVSFPDLGTWEIQAVWLFAGDTLILHPALTPQTQKIVLPPRRSSLLARLSRLDIESSLEFKLESQDIPETIRVRVSGSPFLCDPAREYEVEEVSFRDYVRHVLPNEWHLVDGGGGNGYWESMRAGAVAVKMYAWYWTALGGKWPDADVWDSTCDQVYNPAVEYASANAVVDYTWNWWLSRNGQLLETNYRTYHSQCPDPDSCLGQIEADGMAAQGATWDEILYYFYQDTALSPIMPLPVAGSALRFFGNGYGLYDRVNIRIDDPGDDTPGPPVDVGAGDFTIELWLRGRATDNPAPPIFCGENQNWIYGNVFLDRERRDQDRHYGLALAGGHLVFGITGEDQGGGAGHHTLCSASLVADGRWHHIAVQRRRSDGFVWLFVDGTLEATADGPDGDISYPDNAVPLVESDPFLVLGANKRDTEPSIYPPFNGWMEELHFSNGLRYTASFVPPDQPSNPDALTLAFYRFDLGIGNFVLDSAGLPDGPSHGERRYGGGINGPDWFISDLFLQHKVYLPFMIR